jgi:hypothetical protein
MARILLFLTLMFQSTLWAQEDLDTMLTRRPVIRINLIGIGGGVESPMFPNFTLYVEGGINFGSAPRNTTGFGPQSEKIVIIPYVSLQGRYYYNLFRRKKKGLSVRNYAANFIGISAPYISATDYSRILLGIGPVWGIQRNAGRNGFYGLHIGPGMYFDHNDRQQLEFRVNVNTYASVGFVF